MICTTPQQTYCILLEVRLALSCVQVIFLTIYIEFVLIKLIMIKSNFILLAISLVLFISEKLTAQNDFITIDSTLNSGVELIRGSSLMNAQFIRLKSKDSILTYTADDLIEYGFKGDIYYKSFNVEVNGASKWYFFERLVEGKLNLYYLKTKSELNSYYLYQNDSSGLIPIPEEKEEYVKLITAYVHDCQTSVNNVEYVNLNRNIIKRFFQDYQKCTRRALPRFRYGFNVGVSLIALVPGEPSGILGVPKYNNQVKFQMGGFVDIPIGTSNFSLHPETYVIQKSSTVAFSDAIYNYDLVINNLSINFPLLVRYTLMSFKNSLFFEIGSNYSRAIKNESVLYFYDINEDEIFVEIDETPRVQDDQFGYAVGIGMVFNYDSRSSFFSSLRYGKLYNLKKERMLHHLNETTFSVGFMF